jgi:hypothetical protein
MPENSFCWLAEPAGAALAAYRGVLRREIAEGCTNISGIVFPDLGPEDGIRHTESSGYYQEKQD